MTWSPERQQPQPSFRTLEEWLVADLTGTLAAAPQGGSVVLNEEVRWQLYCARRRRELTRPVACASCGTPWQRRVEIRGSIGCVVAVAADRVATRCPSCRAKRKTAPRGAK